ncbi:hypothetical protein SCYAM73S_00633 [Streptomyces cyaneofuscatus]
MDRTTRHSETRYGNRPTMKDVAARAGVGLKTVSRVVNGRAGVTPDTERRVQEAIDALGFRRNDSARVLGVRAFLVERSSPVRLDALNRLIRSVAGAPVVRPDGTFALRPAGDGPVAASYERCSKPCCGTA